MKTATLLREPIEGRAFMRDLLLVAPTQGRCLNDQDLREYSIGIPDQTHRLGCNC
jgi:hypothetical protein